uniref:Uncharacterized protein n=1 Tax=Arundo donax TaxID=35708 RepID=A0A0A9HFB0_ARUDO
MRIHIHKREEEFRPRRRAKPRVPPGQDVRRV